MTTKHIQPEAPHTPEPWRVEDESTIYGSRANRGDKFEIADCKGYLTERNTNAARIVACVNACAGIPNERLVHVPELLETLHDVAQYVGGWDEPETHPAGKACALLRKLGRI
jgi:hypothetical protein